MSHPTLADFLETLDHTGELAQVSGEVNPSLELAAVVAEEAGSGGKALLFRRVAGHAGAVVANLLGSQRRVCLALGAESLDEWAGRIEELVENPPREGGLSRLGFGGGSTGLVEPKAVKSARCQQVVWLDRDVDLARLPVGRDWPEETHPAITAAQLITVDATSSRRWVERHDVDVLGANRLALRLAPHEPTARVLAEYRGRGEAMPVALALGGDPATWATVMAPLPESVDRWAVAGLLRGAAVEVAPGRRVKLDVPADAEIVLEGTIDPSQPPAEVGPRATPLGGYLPAGQTPVIEVAAITHRANPIWPTMVHGPAPNEWVTLTRAMLRVFLPLVRRVVPELVGLNLPEYGGSRQVGFASIRKTHAGQAHRVAHALLGLPALMFLKWFVVVDEDVDVEDECEVGAAIVAHADPASSVFYAGGVPDPWDPAACPSAIGQKMIIDATAKGPGERPAGHAQRVQASPAVQQAVAARWKELFARVD